MEGSEGIFGSEDELKAGARGEVDGLMGGSSKKGVLSSRSSGFCWFAASSSRRVADRRVRDDGTAGFRFVLLVEGAMLIMEPPCVWAPI